MSRPKGAQTKRHHQNLTIEKMGDVITPQIASEWLTISRAEFMRRIYANEIPQDCFFMSGRNYKIIVRKLALHMGIISDNRSNTAS